LMSIKSILSLDGLPWKRASYPTLVRKLLRLTGRLALYFPHAVIVDSITVQRWYCSNFNKSPIYIPYGANIDLSEPNLATLNRKGLRFRKYIIFVGRLVREKGVHYLVEAFGKIKTDFDLVIIGKDPYGNEYETSLKKMASKNTKFLGYLYGKDYQDLCKGAYFYVTPSDLEGTSPALLTAMALGKCVLVSDISENLETIGDAGISFKHGDSENLKVRLQFLLENPNIVEKIEKKSIERIRSFYDWNVITQKTEQIYFNALSRKNSN
jgi:glycosyltransferase involved in cell wall biosynthesis